MEHNTWGPLQAHALIETMGAMQWHLLLCKLYRNEGGSRQEASLISRSRVPEGPPLDCALCLLHPFGIYSHLLLTDIPEALKQHCRHINNPMTQSLKTK